MKTPEQLRSEQAEEQAALWAARLDGSPLPTSDVADLEGWLAADPLNRERLERYRHFDRGLGDALGEMAAAGLVAKPHSPASKRRSFLKTLCFSTAALAAVVLAFALWPSLRASAPETFASSAAQRRSLALADGTRVELNAKSRLEVFGDSGVRRVRLVEGEAYFEVRKDPARPFIVDTARGSVRVTGTVFDVNAEARAGLAVTVVEGSVLVSPAQGGAVALSLSEQFADGRKRALSASELENALAWRKGLAVFEASPMGEAVALFARYHGRAIEVSPAASGLGVGGRFSLDDLDTFLAALPEMHPVEVVGKPDGTLRVRLRNEP